MSYQAVFFASVRLYQQTSLVLKSNIAEHKKNPNKSIISCIIYVIIHLAS